MKYKDVDSIFEENSLPLTRERKYDNYVNFSTYLTMRDGIKIAADIYLPDGLPSNEKIPTIFVQTCYWRVKVFKKIFKWFEKIMMVYDFIKDFVSFGFAVVYTDVRGTGASTGTRRYIWSEEEIADNKDIADWIISQEWSDGNIVTWGHSYLGTTAELAGVVNHPAFKGLTPMHNEFDPYLNIAFPGGVYDEYFVDNWARYTLSLDYNDVKGLGFLPWLVLKSVKPVDSDENQEMLRKAAKEHINNANVAELAKKSTFRDDPFTEAGESIYNFSVYRYIDEISKSKVPLFSWGSWRDACTSNATIERFLNYKNPQICLIGVWSHAAYFESDPYLPMKRNEPNPTYSKQVEIWIRFYDACLKGKAIPLKLMIYYTMIANEWKTTEVWPPAGQVREKWYFGSNHSLTRDPPEDVIGADDYKVNFKATTGKKNRWFTEMGGGPVIYKNRAKEDRKLLVYDSLPLEKDIEITGHPIVNLHLSSTHKDGAIFVYIEDVDELGNAVHITEGELRLIHRNLSDEEPIYKSMMPYHSFKRKDNAPMIPGEIAEIQFGLIPTSIVLRKGHKIRVAIAGADKDTFGRFPEEGNPIITLARNKKHASYIELPIIQ